MEGWRVLFVFVLHYPLAKSSLTVANKLRQPTLAGINAREFSAGFPLSQSSINETAVTEDLFGSFSCPAYQAVKYVSISVYSSSA